MRGRLWLMVFLGVLALGGSACSGDPEPDPTPTSTGSVQPPDGASGGEPSASASGSTAEPTPVISPAAPGNAGTPPDAAQACGADELEVAFAYGPMAGDGRQSGWLTAKNVSGRTCAVFGLPILQLRAANGSAVPTVNAQRPDTWEPVQRQPGQAAIADVEWSSQGESCQPVTELDVRVNGNQSWMATSFSATVCDQGRIVVTPFHP